MRVRPCANSGQRLHWFSEQMLGVCALPRVAAVNLGGVVWGQDSEVGEHSGLSALSSLPSRGKKGMGNVGSWKRNPSRPEQQTKAGRPRVPPGLIRPPRQPVPGSSATRAGCSPEPLFVVWVIVVRLGGGERELQRELKRNLRI